MRTRVLLLGFHALMLCALISFYYQFPALNGRDGVLPLREYTNNCCNKQGGTGSMPTSTLSAVREVGECLASSSDVIIKELQPQLALFECGRRVGIAPDTWVLILAPLAIMSSLGAIVVLLTTTTSTKGSSSSPPPRSTRILAKMNLLLRCFGLIPQGAFVFMSTTISTATYAVFVSFAGSEFLHFQWDILLLESGLIFVLIAASDMSRTSTFLLRVVAFKLLFLSGVVKVQSQCPTWTHLTAMEYHYATQCIPTRMAWYTHQFSPFIQSMSVAGTLILQVVLSIAFLLPFHSLTFGVGLLHIGLQVMIMLTGHYNFFNALTVLICFEALGVYGVGNFKTHWQQARFYLSRITSLVLSLVACGYCLHKYFNVPILHTSVASIPAVGSRSNVDDTSKIVANLLAAFARPLAVLFEVEERISPTREATGGFDTLVAAVSYHATILCCASVGYMIATDVFRWVSQLLSIFVPDRKSDGEAHQQRASGATLFTKLVQHLVRGAILIIVLAVCVILAEKNLSIVWDHDTITTRGRSSHNVPKLVAEVPVPLRKLTTKTLRLAKSIVPFAAARGLSSFCSPYGLFRRMTGVGNGPGRPTVVARPELVIEGSPDHGTTWHPIHFHFKPGDDPAIAPPLVLAPHQPRLDWQMWFAALSPQPPAWLIHVVYKLMQQPVQGNANVHEDLLLIRHGIIAGPPPSFSKGKGAAGGESNATAAWLSYFGGKQPTMMRIKTYTMDFTQSAAAQRRTNKKSDGTASSSPNTTLWWDRTYKTVWLPAMTSHHTQLEGFLQQMSWDKKGVQAANRRRRRAHPNDKVVFSVASAIHDTWVMQWLWSSLFMLGGGLGCLMLLNLHAGWVATSTTDSPLHIHRKKDGMKKKADKDTKRQEGATQPARDEEVEDVFGLDELRTSPTRAGDDMDLQQQRNVGKEIANELAVKRPMHRAGSGGHPLQHELKKRIKEDKKRQLTQATAAGAAGFPKKPLGRDLNDGVPANQNAVDELFKPTASKPPRMKTGLSPSPIPKATNIPTDADTTLDLLLMDTRDNVDPKWKRPEQADEQPHPQQAGTAAEEDEPRREASLEVVEFDDGANNKSSSIGGGEKKPTSNIGGDSPMVAAAKSLGFEWGSSKRAAEAAAKATAAAQAEADAAKAAQEEAEQTAKDSQEATNTSQQSNRSSSRGHPSVSATTAATTPASSIPRQTTNNRSEISSGRKTDSTLNMLSPVPLDRMESVPDCDELLQAAEEMEAVSGMAADPAVETASPRENSPGAMDEQGTVAGHAFHQEVAEQQPQPQPKRQHRQGNPFAMGAFDRPPSKSRSQPPSQPTPQQQHTQPDDEEDDEFGYRDDYQCSGIMGVGSDGDGDATTTKKDETNASDGAFFNRSESTTAAEDDEDNDAFARADRQAATTTNEDPLGNFKMRDSTVIP